MIETRKLSSPMEVATEAAALAAQSLQKALEVQELATFVLAGGRLPPVAGGVLAEKYASAFDWSRVVFLIGDERCVPLDDPDSSWPAWHPMFQAHPEIPKEHMLRPLSHLSVERAADKYTETLRALRANESGVPILNHAWFGVGEDGHTLSLFPGHSSLSTMGDSLVIPVHNSPKPPPDRISLSYRALEGVESAVVLICGASKAPVLAQIAEGDRSLPIVVASQTIEKAGGHMTWLIDEEAMAQIENTTVLEGAMLHKL